MTDEQIKSLLELCAGATPGPWAWYNGCSYWRLGIDGDQGQHDRILRAYVCKDGWPDIAVSEEDRSFIAAARTALPEALRELQEARRLLADAEVLCECPKEAWCGDELSDSFCEQSEEFHEWLTKVRAFLSRPAGSEKEESDG